MRTLTILLLLAASAFAGPGDWEAIRYGNNETEAGEPGTVTGNALLMEVIAHAVATLSSVFVMTDPLSANGEGAGSDMDTVWYELSFVGDENTSNHAWAIETNINGSGEAEADVVFQGTAIGEALHVIWVTGDHKNKGLGQLGVADSSGVSYSFKPPTGVDITVGSGSLSIGADNFTTGVPLKSTGTGKKCRIRVNTDVQARGSARTVLGHSSVIMNGLLRVNLVMTGTCLWEGFRLKDRFRIGAGGIMDLTASETKAPRGGVTTKKEVPTDSPEDDLPEGDIPPEDEEDEPATSDPETVPPVVPPTAPETGTTTPEDEAAEPETGTTTPEDEADEAEPDGTSTAT